MLLPAIILTFSACSGDKDEPKSITQKDYEIYAGETAEAKGTGLKDLTWESNDKFVANIESDATIQAYRVGWTAIRATGVSGYLSIVVKPKVTEYSEPLIRQNCKWENGQIIVEDWLSQYIWGTNKSLIPYFIKEAGIPWTLASNKSDIMVYSTDNTATPYIGYLFNSEGRMYATCIYLNPFYASNLFDFINERFVIYTVDRLNYTADFAHGQIDYNDEVTINYIGRVGPSSEYILIMYASSLDNPRAGSLFDSIFYKFNAAIR